MSVVFGSQFLLGCLSSNCTCSTVDVAKVAASYSKIVFSHDRTGLKVHWIMLHRS